VAIHEVPEGDMGAMRLVRFMTEPPSVPQFDARQRAVPVHGVGHQGVGADIVVIPKGRERASGASSELGSIET